jgi:hypothetical protein
MRFDGASISRHDVTDQPQTSVIQELKACQGALGEIEEVAKAARHNVKLMFTWGNHDIRFGNRLAQHAPQFKDVVGFKLTDHIPDWDFCWAVWPTDSKSLSSTDTKVESTPHTTIQSTLVSQS